MESPTRQRKSNVRKAESILARRRNCNQHGRIEYLVKWSTSNGSEVSWEPVIMIAEFKNLIKDFLKRLKIESVPNRNSDSVESENSPGTSVSRRKLSMDSPKESLDAKGINSGQEKGANEEDKLVSTSKGKPSQKMRSPKHLVKGSRELLGLKVESVVHKKSAVGQKNVKRGRPHEKSNIILDEKTRSPYNVSSQSSGEDQNPKGLNKRKRGLQQIKEKRKYTLSKRARTLSPSLRSQGDVIVIDPPEDMETQSQKDASNVPEVDEKSEKPTKRPYNRKSLNSGSTSSSKVTSKRGRVRSATLPLCVKFVTRKKSQRVKTVEKSGAECASDVDHKSTPESSEGTAPLNLSATMLVVKLEDHKDVIKPKRSLVRSKSRKTDLQLNKQGVHKSDTLDEIQAKKPKVEVVDVENVSEKEVRRKISQTNITGYLTPVEDKASQNLQDPKSKSRNKLFNDLKESSSQSDLIVDVTTTPAIEHPLTVVKTLGKKGPKSNAVKVNVGKSLRQKIVKKAMQSTRKNKPIGTENLQKNSDSEIKKIEHILGRRRYRKVVNKQGKANRVIEYLVRWKGLNSNHDTWEQHDNICLKTIAAREHVGKFIEMLREQHPTFKSSSGSTYIVTGGIVKVVSGGYVESPKNSYAHRSLDTTPFKDSTPAEKSMTLKKLLESPVVSVKRIKSPNVKRLGKKPSLDVKADEIKNKSSKVPSKKPNKDAVLNQAIKAASQSETASVASSSDSGMLYSLPNQEDEPSDASKVNGKKKDPPSRKKLKLDVEVEDGESGLSTPDTDPEISFKTSPLKKMLLKDSIRPKSQVKPVLQRASTPPPYVVPATPSSLANSTPYKTPPSSPGNKEPAAQATPSRAATALGYVNDMPTVPVMPVLPTSPTSEASYKALMKNLQNLQANRGQKRKGDEEAHDDAIERRISVRQSESAFKYKEIVVKKCQGYTQIWLCTQTKVKNALNPKSFAELQQVLHSAKFDDSRIVLISGSGNVFCTGVDLNFLMTGDRRSQAKAMADGIRDFVTALIQFPKPIMAAVNGPAAGLGMAILPLCDIVYASDKATFSCPYARLGQTPEGAASYTFPTVMGMALANEMLLGGRKLTAIEANQVGLVSQVFWPTTLMQEVIPRVQNMALMSAKSLEASKLLIRNQTKDKLKFTNESECQVLAERWASAECHKALRAFQELEQDMLL